MFFFWAYRSESSCNSYVDHTYVRSQQVTSAIWGLDIVLPVLAGGPEISTVYVRNLHAMMFEVLLSLFGLAWVWPPFLYWGGLGAGRLLVIYSEY